MKDSYCVEVQSSFCDNKDGEMELEIHFNDNQGLDLSSYKRGQDENALIDGVLEDLIQQYKDTLKALEEPEPEESDPIDKDNEKINRLLKEIESLSKKTTKLQKENELMQQHFDKEIQKTQEENRRLKDALEKKEQLFDQIYRVLYN